MPPRNPYQGGYNPNPSLKPTFLMKGEKDAMIPTT